MKGIKKLLTGILAATLALTMNVTAFAAGNITVEQTENGTTYNFYRIFDIVGKDTSNPTDGNYDVVSYSINSEWASFFSGAGAAYISDTNTTGSLSPILVNGATKYINIIDNITESNVVEFTNAATEYAKNDRTIEATITGNGQDMVVPVTEDGYYLMVPDQATIKNGNSTGSLASITATTPNATIKVKAKKPGIEKTDNTVDAEIGQTVHYEITGTVPNTIGKTEYLYKITDQMSEGLTLQKDSIAVKIESTDITSQTTKTFDDANNGFTVDIPVMDLQDYAEKTITVSYDAKVNEKAVVALQQVNKVKLIYGRNPGEETEWKEEELYSSKVIVNKEDDKKTKLAGAQFALLKKDKNGNTLVYYFNETDANDKKVQWVSVDGVSIDDEKTVVTDEMAKALADAKTITKKTTDTEGKADFIGLKDGAYYLVEFAAPLGYNRISNPKKIAIKGTDADAGRIENQAYPVGQGLDARQGDELSTVTVVNNTGSILPSTGGIGTTIFYILGGILIIAGVAYFMVRRKVNAE